ncbi:MAG TPA: lysophospholipid acyltransferase family protein [Clostridia bacterium]|nr:MAG: 1-acyl-sn-glycerol-3-phosphate acyltransferase [Firmicutes bacterium ADurb.Bin146]HOD93218.1 lysophospholipid acyltransferase family protein [Clostridia bacterium]HQM38947.1 lysophospholipid acyltransferase family protein [Clostridia bacterium]
MENEFLRKFCRGIVRGIIKVFYRVEYIGEEYPDEGPYVICPNHFSILDIVFVLVHSRKRWVYFMAKSELYKHKLSAWFLNKMGAFPIKRGQSDIRSIKKAVTLLQQGELVCIFPQGTRQKSRNPLPPRRGVAMVSALTQAKVVPVFIENKAKVYKKTKVYIGKPVDTGLDRKSAKEEIALKSQELMDIIYNLPEVYKDK